MPVRELRRHHARLSYALSSYQTHFPKQTIPPDSSFRTADQAVSNVVGVTIARQITHFSSRVTSVHHLSPEAHICITDPCRAFRLTFPLTNGTRLADMGLDATSTFRKLEVSCNANAWYINAAVYF